MSEERTYAAPALSAGSSTLELFREIIENVIPFNRHLGMRVDMVDDERQVVRLSLELRPEHVGNVVRGMPHGGLLAALIDGASGAAAALTLDDLSQAPSVATIDMRVDFLQPATGSALHAVGTVMRAGRSVVVVRTDVFDDEGALVALGTSTFTVARSAQGERKPR